MSQERKTPSANTIQGNTIQKMFDSIAKRYDSLNSLLSWGLDARWRKALVKGLGDIRGKQGIDICCGTGKLTSLLAKAVGETGSMTGLDFSAGMLVIASRRSSTVKQVRFLQGDALALPFADDTFDFATVAWGLRNVPDIPQALSEMRRVVKPGGKIVSLDMAEPPNAILKDIYWFLFARVVPWLGKYFAKNHKAYQHLYHSALIFPKQEVLSQIFKAAGLTEIEYQNLSCGVTAIVRGCKPFVD